MQGHRVDFTAWLYTQGYADRSVGEYDKWARRWTRHCWAHDTTPAEAPVRMLAEWAASLPVGRESRKQAHTALSHLHRFIGREDGAHGAIRVPPKKPTRTPPLADDDARALRDTAVMVGGRQGAACLSGLYTTARRIEIARLRWSDMDLDRQRFRWERAKHGGPGDLHMHDVLAKALLRLPHTGSDYVFPGNNGRPHVAPATIWSWVRKVGRIAGVQVATHQLRATCITQLAEKHSVLIAAHAAGHRDLNETLHYLRDQSRATDEALATLDW